MYSSYRYKLGQKAKAIASRESNVAKMGVADKKIQAETEVECHFVSHRFAHLWCNWIVSNVDDAIEMANYRLV